MKNQLGEVKMRNLPVQKRYCGMPNIYWGMERREKTAKGGNTQNKRKEGDQVMKSLSR